MIPEMTRNDNIINLQKVANLMALAGKARLVRLYQATSHKGYSVSIANGQTTYQTLTRKEFENLKSRLIVDGWKLTPMISCWGWAARKPQPEVEVA